MVMEHENQPNVGVNTGNRGLGRPKGSVNKTTKALKDMILGALDAKGGQEYLMKQADENPTAFLTLIGKVLPTTLAGDPDAPLVTVSKEGIDARIAELTARLNQAEKKE
jgi:hypothetical protein